MADYPKSIPVNAAQAQRLGFPETFSRLESTMNHQYEVTIGGRLVAIVNAPSSMAVLESVKALVIPDKPAVPQLKLLTNGQVAA